MNEERSNLKLPQVKGNEHERSEPGLTGEGEQEKKKRSRLSEHQADRGTRSVPPDNKPPEKISDAEDNEKKYLNAQVTRKRIEGRSNDFCEVSYL